ncbi:T9SS type A sorting domain-containing protein [Candidatus Poribacteria bacterium]|nr:T9SS type A sorting domain-containing protein [Candidatus Poribacteria bacterium]
MRTLILFFLSCFLLPVCADIRFEDVSQQAGITRIGESWGNAWGDFDGDGDLDLWATNHRHKPSLYRNNGDGTFTDIIDEVWDANPYADTHGVAWADFDNDGDQDLIALSGGGGGRILKTNPREDNHLYVNEGGILLERAAELGVDFPLLRGRTPLWFDWNRDGRLDVLITGIRRVDGTGKAVTSYLFQQVPSGFEDVSRVSGFLFERSSSLAQLSDITDDGNMDLIIHSNPYPRKMYDVSVMPFRNLTEVLNFPKRYDVQDAIYADFNGDLISDVFLARGRYSSYIDTQDAQRIKISILAHRQEKGVSFKTEGDVRFEIYSVWATWLSHLFIGTDGHRLTEFNGEYIPVDPSRNAATFKFVLSPEDPRVAGLKKRPKVETHGMYVGYDPGTKRWTVLFHTMPRIATTGQVTMDAVIEASQPISEPQPINFSIPELTYRPQSILFINEGNNFKPTNGAFVSDVPSVTAGDFDNDMDVDLYVVRSTNAGNLPNHLYENRGDGTFIQHAGAGGANGSAQGKGQSVTMGDYDQDGYLDLFVTNGRGGYPFNIGPDQLFRNIASGNNWLQIDLEGTVSNRDGIGARLFATTPDGKTQLRENGGGIHWCQQDQKRIHFGLAQNQVVSELVIHWPSGIVQKLEDVPVNQVLKIVESGAQGIFSADVNQDGRVGILDFVLVVEHFGEKPPTNFRVDINKDGEVNILDLIWIIKSVGGNQGIAGAPSRQLLTGRITKGMSSSIYLSKADIGLLSSFYERIEEISASATHKELVRQFLKELLRSVEEPLDTRLHANYPNPFNPETWIPYQLAEDSNITIRIYDTSGHIVRTLFAGHQTAGYYMSRRDAVYWDGKNELGEHMASGVYICELETPTFKHTTRLVMLK